MNRKSTLSPAQTMLLRSLGPWALSAWLTTLTVEAYLSEGSICPSSHVRRGVIYVGWHESLLTPAFLYARNRPYTLVSQSLDGEMISLMISRLGWRTIRGSSSTNAIQCADEMIDILENDFHTDCFLAADGPTGPRRKFKEGPVYLASRTGRQIVPLAFGYERCWRARSWDCLALPKPLSRVTACFGTPIEVTEGINKQQRKLETTRLEREMAALQARADSLALTSALPNRTEAKSDNGLVGHRTFRLLQPLQTGAD